MTLIVFGMREYLVVVSNGFWDKGGQIYANTTAAVPGKNY